MEFSIAQNMETACRYGEVQHASCVHLARERGAVDAILEARLRMNCDLLTTIGPVTMPASERKLTEAAAVSTGKEPSLAWAAGNAVELRRPHASPPDPRGHASAHVPHVGSRKKRGVR